MLRSCSGGCGSPSCVLGVSSRSWLAVTAMRRPGREGFVGKYGSSSRFRQELHTLVTLLSHPDSAVRSFPPVWGANDERLSRAAADRGGTCAEAWSSWKNPRGGVDFVSSPSRLPQPRRRSFTVFITRPSRARSQPARAVTETAALADPASRPFPRAPASPRYLSPSRIGPLTSPIVTRSPFWVTSIRPASASFAAASRTGSI